jgi:hypothetical protein
LIPLLKVKNGILIYISEEIEFIDLKEVVPKLKAIKMELII